MAGSLSVSSRFYSLRAGFWLGELRSLLFLFFPGGGPTCGWFSVKRPLSSQDCFREFWGTGTASGAELSETVQVGRGLYPASALNEECVPSESGHQDPPPQGVLNPAP